MTGSVVGLWRYPVKSMMGEELTASEVTPVGLLGDRAWALVSEADGKVGSAKNPRRWPGLLDWRADFTEPPRAGAETPPVRLTLPDGTTLLSGQADLGPHVSKVLGRPVTLRSAGRGPTKPMTAEGYWPDMEGLDPRDTVTEFTLPIGTFFDAGVIHLLTTATLARLAELYPRGRFDVRRFRPNLLLDLGPEATGFVEASWPGSTLRIGDEVRLAVTRPCSRCVMTTLAQADLPEDAGILRTLAKHTRVQIGVYAAVERGGTIRRGDIVYSCAA